MVKGHSGVQIALHWVVGLLILFQLIFSDAMGPAWRQLRDGGVPYLTTMVWAHILAGSAVLALVVWRLWLRLTRGVPGEPEGEGAVMRIAAQAGHWGLYAVMIGAPVTGLLAW